MLRTAMPKTSVNKNGDPLSREGNVSLYPGNDPLLKPKPGSHRVQDAT